MCEACLSVFEAHGYARVITPEADGGYSAEIVEFPGCVTQGETVEEAYANLEDAAFWPVRQLAELLRTKQVTSMELTNMYLTRLPPFLPRSIYPPAMAPTTRNGSTPVAIASGSGASAGSSARPRRSPTSATPTRRCPRR